MRKMPTRKRPFRRRDIVTRAQGPVVFGTCRVGQGNNPGMWEVVDNGGIGGYVSDVLGKSATCRL